MKSFISVLALTGYAVAYPSILAQLEQEAGSKSTFKRASTVAFDAEAQYVSNTGEYAFVAPSGDDQRGPCPGLNAAANHGYLPHSGVASIADFVTACNKVFGMGIDLGTFLGVYGAVFDGDGTQWSIGGPTASVDSFLGLLDVGVPQGISGSHNNYESDVSPTRGDLYEYGNDYLVQMSQFDALYAAGEATNSYDLPLLTKFRAERFNQSIANNPYFFNGPFTGVAVQPAAYTFIYRFMANKSAEYPEGLLDGSVLKTFFSITGEPGNFTYNAGYEAIPDNWYTRNAADPYTIPFFMSDLIQAAEEYPMFIDVGGNTGTVNSFSGVDITDLTGGVYNSKTLLEGNNLACFAFQAAIQAGPDFLSGLGDDTSAEDMLGDALNNATGSFGCANLDSIDMSQFSKYPGFTSSYDGYTGEKATTT